MLTQTRHERILHILEVQHSVTVLQLASELDASESTIRRDLAALDKQGKLIKVHGGATVLHKDILTKEDNVSAKRLKNVSEKELIAKYAATLINNNDFVYIDAGTTTLRLIDYINCKDAIFVTNGVEHAKKLIEKGARTYIVGGLIKRSTEAVIGNEAAAQIEHYNFTKSFMGTNGIAINEGFTTPDIEEASFKKEVVKHSYMTYILADVSKFGVVSAVSFAELQSSCIITNGEIDKMYKDVTMIKEVQS